MHCRLVGHSHDHLLSTEEGIADEFACAQRYRLLSVCHVCCLLPLAKTMDNVDVHAATNRERVAGTSMGKQSRVDSSVICVCAG